MAKLHEDRIDLVDGGEHARSRCCRRCARRCRPCSWIEPMRPDTGARISVKLSWVSTFWRIGLVGLELRLEQPSASWNWCRARRPCRRPWSAGRRRAMVSRLACIDLRLVLADLRFDLRELGLAACALSSSNSRSPSLTSAPSSTLTFMIWLSRRGLIWIGGDRLHRADGLDDDRHRPSARPW